MAISFIGAASGITSATLPAHSVGDIILGLAFRDGNTTPPTIDASFTTINNSAGANSCSLAAGYMVADSASEVSGTWSSATSVIFLVYSGVDTADPIGGLTQTGGSSTTVAYNGITMDVGDGTSTVIGFAGHRSTNTSLETPPTGMSLVSTAADATDEAAAHSAPAATSWSTQSVSVGGTSSGWRSLVFELKAAVASTGNARHGMLMGMG